MIIDEVTRNTLYEVQAELKEEGIEISVQELAEIVGSQFKTATVGFAKGVNVRIPRFGTFVRVGDKRKIAKKNMERQKLKDVMGEEEFMKMVYAEKDKRKEEIREQRKKDRNTTYSIEDLKKMDTRNGLTNKYLKHTDDERPN